MHFGGNLRALGESLVGWVLALSAFACSEAPRTPPAVASGGARSDGQTVASATTSGGKGGVTDPGSGGIAGTEVDATGGSAGQGGRGFPTEGGFGGGPAAEAGVPPSDAQAGVVTARKWHPTALTFDGPTSSEMATPNPFR